MLWGLVANAQHACWPSPSELHLLGAQVIRTIVYDLDGFDQVITEFPPGIPIIAMMNQETAGVGEDLSGWATVCGDFMSRFAGRVLALECLNEWDSAVQAISPTVAAACAATALELGKPIRGAPRVVLGAVAGENWVQSLHDAVAALAPGALRNLAGVGLHPYGQRADGYPDEWGYGELHGAILTAHGIAHRPVWVTEYGINLTDVEGDEIAQARYLTRCRTVMERLSTAQLMVATQFAWRDDAGGPGELFGLRDGEDVPRVAWGAAMGQSS